MSMLSRGLMQGDGRCVVVTIVFIHLCVQCCHGRTCLLAIMQDLSMCMYVYVCRFSEKPASPMPGAGSS